MHAQWLVFLALVGQYSKYLMKFMNVGTLFLIVVTYGALVLINFLACIWFFTATPEGLERPWLNAVGEPPCVPCCPTHSPADHLSCVPPHAACMPCMPAGLRHDLHAPLLVSWPLGCLMSCAYKTAVAFINTDAAKACWHACNIQ